MFQKCKTLIINFTNKLLLQSNAAEKVLAMNQLTPGINSNYQESTDDNLKLFSRNLSHQIHAGTKARYLKDMREELLETCLYLIIAIFLVIYM